MFTCMVEVLFSSYKQSERIVGFDRNLLTKLHNMKAQLERMLNQNANFIDKHGDESMQVYHLMTDVFERILQAGSSGDSEYFGNLIGVLQTFHQDQSVKTVSDNYFNGLEEKVKLAEQRFKMIANFDKGGEFKNPFEIAKTSLKEFEEIDKGGGL